MRTKRTTSNDLPLFAQPLNGAPRRNRSASSVFPKMNGIWTAISIGVGIVFLAVAVPNSAQDRPSTKTKSETETPRVEPGAATHTKATASDVKSQAGGEASSRRPIEFYTRNVRDTMFSAPQPPPPPKPKPVIVKVEKPKPLPPPHIPVLEINPFEDWAYTGTVKMGDQIMALLENTKTKEGQYIHSGDSFMGAQVSEITDQMVTLTSGGKPHMLAKSDAITLTPLDKSAAYLSGGAPGGTPGQPPMPGGMPPGMMPPGMPQPGMVTLPNGRALTPTQAVRRTRRLNRQFNAP